MRIACRFADQSFTITLEDNPTARDLFSLLPVDLTIEDYSTNEKIAYLPRKLSGEGAQPFGDEAAGDFCYYAPWGNIVFFYETYRYSRGLIRLGRLDGGIAPLLLRGEFPLRIDPAA
ncbi:MFS transporter [Rhodobacteraceae bacterium GS-10]|uniref:MFS transporter n=2 Tax=Thalassovita mangrovi TaxID=2692236 RepID=A0A6L8LIZ6_9RHOB|nr:MFS transporter [Thalassovita mangrovi]